jgi:hypothetical protein
MHEALGSWKETLTKARVMDEKELLTTINFEVSTYARKDVLKRLHQRYNKLRCRREREELLAGGLLL